MPNDPPQPYQEDYALRNRQQLAQIAAQLQANMQMMGSNTPVANTTYRRGQPFTAPNMFGQAMGGISSMFGEEAGGMASLIGGLIPAFAGSGMLGPLPGLVSAMQTSMPIGGGDAGAFMYAQMQRRVGKSLPKPVQAPLDFKSNAAIDYYNEEQAQYEQFASQAPPGTVPNFKPGAHKLLTKNKTFGTPNPANQHIDTRAEYGDGSGYSKSIELANVQEMTSNSRFKSMYGLFEAATGDELGDAEVQKLIKLAQSGTADDAKEANKTLTADKANGGDLARKVDRIVNNANKTSGLINFSKTLSTMANSVGGAAGIELGGMAETLMAITGADRDVSMFNPAALQSLSMKGGLGTAMTKDANGKLVPVVDQMTARLGSHLTDDKGPYKGARDMGAMKSGELMTELATSGLLTSGGVDTYGSLKPEDIKKMEEAVAMQLEGFSEVAAAGKRIGLQVGEIVQSMNRVYGGQLGVELADAAGAMRADFDKLNQAGTGTVGDDLVAAEERRTGQTLSTGSEERRMFLNAEAQRQAGATMMQRVEEAVQVGRYAGLDARGSMALIETASQLAGDMGMSGGVGLQMGRSAMGRMAIGSEMGIPMSADQALAQSKDVMNKASKNRSVQGFSSLKLALREGVLNDSDPKVQALLKDFESGKPIDPAAVNKLLLDSGVKDLSAFTSTEAVNTGMGVDGSAASISKYYATNEDVSLTGTIKRKMQKEGAIQDVEAFTKTLTTGSSASDIAKAFFENPETANNGQAASTAALDKLKDMSFGSFAAEFNKMGSQQERVALLDKLTKSGSIDAGQRASLLSNLGNRIEQYGLAGDKGTQRTAKIRLEEEQQIRTNSGMTDAELSAVATADIQDSLNDAFRANAGGTGMADMAGESIKHIRQDKADKIKKTRIAAGGTITDDEAMEQAKKEDLTLTEMFQVMSGNAGSQMKKNVVASLASAKDELKTATDKGDKAGEALANRKITQLTDMEAYFNDDDPETKEARKTKILENLQKEKEQQAVDVTKNMGTVQKTSYQADQSTISLSKNMEAVLVQLTELAVQVKLGVNAIGSLDRKV